MSLATLGKHATRRDFIYLSPELAALLRDVQVQNDFAEHSTLIAGLQIDVGVGHHPLVGRDF